MIVVVILLLLLMIIIIITSTTTKPAKGSCVELNLSVIITMKVQQS